MRLKTPRSSGRNRSCYVITTIGLRRSSSSSHGPRAANSRAAGSFFTAMRLCRSASNDGRIELRFLRGLPICCSGSFASLLTFDDDKIRQDAAWVARKPLLRFTKNNIPHLSIDLSQLGLPGTIMFRQLIAVGPCSAVRDLRGGRSHPSRDATPQIDGYRSFCLERWR